MITDDDEELINLAVATAPSRRSHNSGGGGGGSATTMSTSTTTTTTTTTTASTSHRVTAAVGGASTNAAATTNNTAGGKMGSNININRNNNRGNSSIRSTTPNRLTNSLRQTSFARGFYASAEFDLNREILQGADNDDDDDDNDDKLDAPRVVVSQQQQQQQQRHSAFAIGVGGRHRLQDLGGGVDLGREREGQQQQHRIPELLPSEEENEEQNDEQTPEPPLPLNPQSRDRLLSSNQQNDHLRDRHNVQHHHPHYHHYHSNVRASTGVLSRKSATLDDDSAGTEQPPPVSIGLSVVAPPLSSSTASSSSSSSLRFPRARPPGLVRRASTRSRSFVSIRPGGSGANTPNSSFGIGMDLAELDLEQESDEDDDDDGNENHHRDGGFTRGIAGGGGGGHDAVQISPSMAVVNQSVPDPLLPTPTTTTMATTQQQQQQQQQGMIYYPPSPAQNRNSEAATAAAAMVVPASMPPPVPKQKLQRQTSWYQDALKQGLSGQDMEAIFGIVLEQHDDDLTDNATDRDDEPNYTTDEDNINNDDVFDDEEVLEQYRIMAHHEARQRVKENLGMDVTEYLEQRRGLDLKKQAADRRSPTSGSNSHTTLPLSLPPPPRQRRRPSSCGDPAKAFAYDIPAAPVAAPKTTLLHILQQQRLRSEEFRSQQRSESSPKCTRPTELQTGIWVESAVDLQEERTNNNNINTSEGNDPTLAPMNIAVRCLGCRGLLRVNPWATLVRCPKGDCGTVSPVTSTRR